MRFPSRGRWLLWLVLLFAVGPILVVLFASLWLSRTMNPVQTYYLGTYTACSLVSRDPGAMTTVRYAEKTAPGRTPETLLPEDSWIHLRGLPGSFDIGYPLRFCHYTKSGH